MGEGVGFVGFLELRSGWLGGMIEWKMAGGREIATAMRMDGGVDCRAREGGG